MNSTQSERLSISLPEGTASSVKKNVIRLVQLELKLRDAADFAGFFSGRKETSPRR